MSIPQNTILVYLSLLFMIPSCALYDVNNQLETTRYNSGEIKSLHNEKFKKMKKTDINDYYVRWDEKLLEFDENGIKVSESEQKYKNGTSGRSCYEIVYSYKEYYLNGKVKYEQIDRCDCRKSIEKSYTMDGKLKSKVVARRKSDETPEKKKK